MAPVFKSRKREFHDFDPSAIDEESVTDHCSRTRHLWPKIRAIHSDDDKEFVRYLGQELGKMCYDVFDDGDIYEGGRGCRLVLVVISDKFLRTEACMAEFTLVMNDSDWICLFYDISVEEFLNQNNLAKWREVWESWQLGIQVCDEAAWHMGFARGRTLDCSTMADGNTTEFMKIIAQTISSRFIPLQVHWSQQTSCIRGRTRLCWEVDKCFSEGPLCDEDVRVLGLHGMWSVGKTSLAKALCDFYSTEFQGRVYHAELLEQSSDLQLMKDLLRNLLGAKQDFLEQNLICLGQAYAYLDHCLKQSSEKVFLVVDNIQDSWECLERARDLFLRRVPFPKGSMVLCLARSSHTLEQLLLPLDKLCRIETIPSLTAREGYWIFVDVLFSNLSGREAILWREVTSALEFSSILHVCVDRQPHRMGAVHPLRFKSLGCFFREKGAQYWLSAFAQHSADAIFEDMAKWKEDNALKTVFKALHESYDSLDQQVQQFFIDVALYVPKRDLSWLWRLDHDKDDFFSSGFECLQKLRAVTLLTIEERRIKMHRLCRKFAEKVARHSEALVYVVGETVSKADVCMMLDHRADVIQKVCFENCFFDNGDSLEPFILDLSNCKLIQVLRLVGANCQHMLQVCLGRSKLLTLEISSISTPVVFTGDLSCVRCFSGSLDTVTGSLVENLEVLEINMRKKSSAVGLEPGLTRFCAGYEKFTLQDFDWGACELEVLCLTGSHCIYRSRELPLDVWPRLRELTLFQVGGLETLGGLRDLHNLRSLHVESLTDLVSLDGTELLSRLQEMHVIECRGLSELQLPAWLKHCCIWFCDNLEIINVTRTGGDRVDDDDDDVDEIRRYYPCPDQDDEKMTCSHLQKFVQMSSESILPRLSYRGCETFVSFSSKSKFSIVGCTGLHRCDGLQHLVFIEAFEFGRCNKNLEFQVDHLNATAMAMYVLHHRDRGLFPRSLKPAISVPISNLELFGRTEESEGEDGDTIGFEQACARASKQSSRHECFIRPISDLELFGRTEESKGKDSVTLPRWVGGSRKSWASGSKSYVKSSIECPSMDETTEGKVAADLLSTMSSSSGSNNAASLLFPLGQRKFSDMSEFLANRFGEPPSSPKFQGKDNTKG